MAPLFHLANEILLEAEKDLPDPRSLATRLRKLASEEERSVAEISQAFAASGPWKRVLTLSRSGTVTSALVEAGRRGKLVVQVLESLPGGEGRVTASELIRRSLDVELVPDSLAFEAAKGCDLALVGADSISPEGAVNKVGSRAVAEACRVSTRPYFVAASTLKLMPFSVADRVRRVRLGKGGVVELSQVFEEVPLVLVTSIITEKGVRSAEESLAAASRMPVAREWALRP